MSKHPSKYPPLEPGIAGKVEQPRPIRGGRGWFSRNLIRIGFALLILGPLVIYELPREIARWYLAAAVEEANVGEEDSVLELIDEALKWDPSFAESNPLVSDAYAQRSMTRLEENDLDGALEDSSRAVQLAPNRPAGYSARCQVYLRQKHFAEAVSDSSKVLDLLAPEQTSEIGAALNNRAYFVALGIAEGELSDDQLEAALRDVGKAIEGEPNSDTFLDTRGYLYFLQGEKKLALADFDQAIDVATLRNKRELLLLRGNEELREKFMKMRGEGLSVMYFHRHLVHEAMGSEKQSSSDRTLAIELGYNPNAGIQ